MAMPWSPPRLLALQRPLARRAPLRLKASSRCQIRRSDHRVSKSPSLERFRHEVAFYKMGVSAERRVWLGRRDSNPNNLLQRQVSYR